MSQLSRSPRDGALPKDPELQRLLGQARLEYESPRDEAAAFRRLTLELERRSPERGLRPWLWVCATVAVAAVGVLLVRGQLAERGSTATLRLAPEPVAPALPRPEEAQRQLVAEPALAPPTVTERDEAPVAQPERDDSVALPRRRLPAPPKAAPVLQPQPAPGAESAEEDCLALARDGAGAAAESCFERRSAGAGLGAEMALYELARLRRDVLDDGEGALEALGEYRQRFPAGSLRNEVDVSRIELLARLQRGQEALRASEQLLATPAGRERAAELRLLRGNVQRAAGSLREAIAEYASAEQLGGALGEEAAFLRAQCLEALGDVAAAREAYARAAQTAGPRRSEAQQRLELLSNALLAR